MDVHKPISTKLSMWIEDVRAIFPIDNCFEIWPLLFGLGAPEFCRKMTDARFFSYKLLIYEPNLTKFQKIWGQ